MVQADEKFEVILEAARELFFSRGYDTTSMDLVAREAAVSKATVYSHFKSKEQLLLTLVETEVNELPLARHPRPPTTASELRDVLTGMAEEFVLIFQQDRTRSLCRLVMAQAHIYPQIARAFYEAAPLRTRREVVEVLDGAVAAGLLRISDTSIAALQFLNLAGGELPMLSLLSLPLTTPDALRPHIESAINVFLAAYGTDATD